MTALVDLLDDAGLTGRGGAGFRTATKVRAAQEHGSALIVNACDSEIGAAKDAWIVQHHLAELVDGAGLVGFPGRVRFAAHRGSATAQTLAAAGVSVLEVPARYVSSEETSLIALAQGRPARPMTRRGHFVAGERDSQGRRIPPTVVLNAETVWRIAQVNRYGPHWFRQMGTEAEPGPRLVAVGGHVGRSVVVEAAAGWRLVDILASAGGLPEDVREVGVGGLGGVLLSADQARDAVWDTPGMARVGGAMGPGIVTVWDPRDCPLHEVTRMLEFAAGESAGQCGPCMFGLPALVEGWRDLCRHPDGQTRARVDQLTGLLPGRGACRFPDGVARFVASAVLTLEPHLAEHAHGICSTRGVTRNVQYA